MAKVVPTPYETALIVYEEGKEKKRTVYYNAVPAKLPLYRHKLYLVVVKGFGMEPMMLLTSCARVECKDCGHEYLSKRQKGGYYGHERHTRL